MVFQRMEAKKIYDTQNDLFWSTYILKSSKPDYTKADTLFTRNYKDEKSNFSELHVNLYYFTLYSLHSAATGEKQLEYRIRLINTFYDLKDHMSRTGMSPKATQNLETYLNNAIKGCDDICDAICRWVCPSVLAFRFGQRAKCIAPRWRLLLVVIAHFESSRMA
jgi:hypothetical protein